MRNSLCFLMIGMFVGLCGCAGAEPGIKVSCDDFYAEGTRSGMVELASGERLELVLCSNPTTGFKWDDQAEISEPAVLEQVAVAFEEPAASEDKALAGAPGAQKWTFQGMGTGSTQVVLTYSQPWEGGEKNAWTYTLSVTVR